MKFENFRIGFILLTFVLLSLGLALVTLTCTTRNKKQEESIVTQTNRVEQVRAKHFCIGRFQFDMPVDLTVSGRSQLIYRVIARTIEFSEQSSAAEVWKQRLSKIHQTVSAAYMNDRDLESFELEPGISAI